jgi:hypothetical protein
MMKKAGVLAGALRNSGATVASAQMVEVENMPARPQRITKPITVHFPEAVRRQIKTLAAEQGRSIEDVVGEAFNLLFAQHRKPEIAPRK